MPRLPDLVVDSRLRTLVDTSTTIHSYLEIDEVGRRFSRKEYWKWERHLGRGGFGQVQLQRCTNGTKKDALRAVKKINKPSSLSKSIDFNRELEAIAKFSHDRYRRWFVKSSGWYEDENFIFITMDYCRYGDLQHYLEDRHSIPAAEVQQLAHQMLEGLHQMHQNDFAHRDLKPGNILIKSMPPEEKWWIVLADFGISKRADEGIGPTTAIKGTEQYMAPETRGFLKQHRPKSIADFKATDMWALGEIIFQTLTGEATFQDIQELMEYCLGQREFPLSRLPTSTGVDGREFIIGIMTTLPHDRMTTSQCLQHRWMEPLLRLEEEPLRVEEDSTALDFGHTGLPVPEPGLDESASARWSNLSRPERTPTQTTAQQRPTRPMHLSSSSAGQPEARSTFDSPLIRDCLVADQESSVLANNALVRTLEGHSGVVNSVAFSPYGERLALGSWDGTVRV